MRVTREPSLTMSNAAEVPSRRFPAYQESVMVRNVEAKVNGDKLILTVDISKEKRDSAPLSKSEKTKLVGSTGGFVSIGGVGFSLNVNCAK